MLKLLLQLQDKDQLLATYSTENVELTSALSTTESRLRDLYAEQSRWEIELSQRIDISDKLRDQLRELEKEKRDIQRRYNEQVHATYLTRFFLSLITNRPPHLKLNDKPFMTMNSTSSRAFSR